MDSEKNLKHITVDELRSFQFAPADIFWLKKYDEVRLLRWGDVIDHGYFFKFEKFEKSLAFKGDLNFQDKNSIYSRLKKLLNEFISAKTIIERNECQERFLHLFADTLWSGEKEFGTYALIEAFASSFGVQNSKSIDQMKTLSHQVYSMTCLKAALSCSLALVLGYNHPQLIKELYRAHFHFFSLNSENCTIDLNQVLLGHTKREEYWKLLELSLESGLKGLDEVSSNFEFPIIARAFRNIVPRLFDKESLGDVKFWNFSDMEELLFFTHKIFYHRDLDFSVMEKLLSEEGVTVGRSNLSGALKQLFLEFKTNYDHINLNFFEFVEARLSSPYSANPSEEERIGA